MGNGYDSGHVRVYKYKSNKWIQIGKNIDGEAVENESGTSVSLSSDGKIVAIGAIYNINSNGFYAGQVRVYQLKEPESESECHFKRKLEELNGQKEKITSFIKKNNSKKKKLKKKN